MNWTKNLSKLRLPRSAQRSPTRYWQTLQDHASRDMPQNDDGPDYSKALDSVRFSAVIMACVGFVATRIPLCPWVLERRVDGAWEPVDTHPILDLLANPTPWHGGPEMLSTLVVDYLIAGTAYLQRVAPQPAGPPRELWWRPAESLYPVLNEERSSLQGYQYVVDDKKLPLWTPDDAVQVRYAGHGQNPANPWLGVSPLAALGPEVWINREATRMTAALLKKLGQAGIVIILEKEALDSMKEGDADAMKKYLREGYTGERRGDALFIEFPARFHGGALVDPALMHPKALRDYVQEMVCSVYRLPAAVLQFGVGLEAATQNATVEQFEKQAWETGILDVQNALSSQIGRQLLPAFELDIATYRLGFDTSKVEVLQKNRKEEAEMWGQLVRDGIVPRSQALEALGLPFEASDEVRHMPISVIEVPIGMTMLEAEEERTPEPEPTPAPVVPPEEEEEEDDQP